MASPAAEDTRAPRLVRRACAGAAVAAAANLGLLVVILHLSLVDRNYHADLRFALGAEAVTILLTAAGATAAVVRFRRLKAALRASSGRLCTECLYPLPPSPNSGLCPECGVAYDLERAAAKWRRVGWR